MIDRSGIRRILILALAAAATTLLAAACGGRVDGGGSSSGSTGNDTSSCTGTAVSCPLCKGDTTPTHANCVDGQWQCPVSKCAVDTTCTGTADCKCGTATCQNGEWKCPRSCACPTNLAGLDGTPCDVEGLSCSGDCSNPCNFCNILQCSNGTWTNLEAFPEPCDDGGFVIEDGGVGGH